MRLAICFFLFLAHAAASDPALVRTELKPGETTWVGQRVPLVVELLGEGRFHGTPRFDFPELEGALLIRIEERPVLGTETVAETTYTVQRHEFAVFAQRGGAVKIPAFEVRFSVAAGFVNVKPVEYVLFTRALAFEAKMPPGAEKLGSIISTRNLVVKERWEPEPGEEADVGDAFSRSVAFTAPEVPAMAFPPLPHVEINGLGIYPKPPAVHDRTERGAFLGEREERVVYVCERPGPVSLPALVVHWWNLDANKLERVELPGKKLVVVQAVVPEAEESFPWAWLGLVPLLLAGAAWVFRGPIRARYLQWKSSLEESEPAYFNRVLKACRSGDARAALNALMQWIDRRDDSPVTPTLSGFLKAYPDPVLERLLGTLQEAALAGKKEMPFTELTATLRGIRKRPQKTSTSALLPGLNP